MNFILSDQQLMLVETFRRLFETESSMARVRAAESLGHDPALLARLAEVGALSMRVPVQDGESAYGIFDVALMMEEAGRTLASAPIAEVIVAARLLALLGGNDDIVARATEGNTVITLALHEARSEKAQTVPGGAVAESVLFLVGDEVKLASVLDRGRPPLNHGSMPVASLLLEGRGALPSRTLAKGSQAPHLFRVAVEEWKLLSAATLTGLGMRAVEIAAAYAKERKQFDRVIGSFQAIAHPLADRYTDMRAAQLLCWWAIRQVSDRAHDAAAAVSMAWWWAASSSSEAVARALHSFGGYGLTNEYDIQLYHRRAKAIALQYEDPRNELLRAGKRLWSNVEVPLPDAGPIEVEFSWGEKAQALAEDTRRFFAAHLTPEWHENAHYSYDGHDPELNLAMGKAGLLFPNWPVEYGGRGATQGEALAALEVWNELGVTAHAQNVSNMVGLTIIKFGSELVKRVVLPRIASGEILMCLGYSEPSSGSDVFAARTRAVRDRDEWVINGQKMFTSGANLASHALMLTRTNVDVPKHAGITLFLVPLDHPGVEIRPVHTFQEERTNATFYTDVRISDDYRIGPVDGGSSVLGWALSLEQGGAGFVGPHRRLLNAAVDWARKSERDGIVAIKDARVLERLAAVAVRVQLSQLMLMRSVWRHQQAPDDRGAGPMSKLLSSEFYLRDAADLFDLAAPDTIWRSKSGPGEIELLCRHAAATTIYAGTSEVHRSQIAEKELGLPRSR
jgi:alkylation response protein AidB-like acyl-CoA dehydrogenase